MLLPLSLSVQFSRASRDSIRALSQADHKLMLEQLDIAPSDLRHGPSGNPADANAANTDEAKARSYEVLPDPLVFNNGDTVRTAAEWETLRRTEIMELFDREIYGRIPENVPGVRWEILSVKDTMDGDQAVRIKHLIGHVENSSFPEINVDIELVLGTPAQSKKAVPMITEFGYNWTPAQLARFRRGHPLGRAGNNNSFLKVGDMPSWSLAVSRQTMEPD